MILDLNLENVNKLKAENKSLEKDIDTIINNKRNNNINNIFFDFESNKIYTEIDYARLRLHKKNAIFFPFNYPDLIPEYYNINLKKFLNDKQKLLGIIYNEKEQTKEFILEQIKKTSEIINHNQSDIDKHPNASYNSKKNNIIIHKGYKVFLDKKMLELNNQETKLTIVSSEVFKEKYQSDIWHKYENESTLFKSSTEKINYWNNKLLEYQKDKINLDYLGKSLLTLDVNLKKPKHLNGFMFDTFCKKNIELLSLENQENKPLHKEINKPKDIESKHPKFNPNLWSFNCYLLFKYLFDNYYEDSKNKYKRNLTNIWFYLKEYDKLKYTLKATKDSYQKFIKENYNIEIKNFDKAGQKYNTEYGTMNEHRINFEDSF